MEQYRKKILGYLFPINIWKICMKPVIVKSNPIKPDVRLEIEFTSLPDRGLGFLSGVEWINMIMVWIMNLNNYLIRRIHFQESPEYFVRNNSGKKG